MQMWKEINISFRNYIKFDHSFYCASLLLLLLALSSECFGQNTSYSIKPSPIEKLTLYVPATVGGGWDHTAQAMRDTILYENLAIDVDIVYSPGAGGLIGLAQFIESQRGNSSSLLIGGVFMVGASSSHHSSVSLLDTLPLAKLTGDSVAIAVPQSSPFTNVDELLEALITKPENITWVGGSSGGTDELFLSELARALNISKDLMPYYPLPGGGQVGEMLSNEQYIAGVSGYSEFESYVDNGQLRVLAISSDSRLKNIPVPTLKELGVDVVLTNWRGVFSAPGISVEDRMRQEDVIRWLVQSNIWKSSLLKYHWQDLFQTGTDFEEFVLASHERLKDNKQAANKETQEILSSIMRILARRYTWAIIAGCAAILLLFGMVYQRYRSRRQELKLYDKLTISNADAELISEKLNIALSGATNYITSEFARWNLTLAEQDVALLMLKGLRLQDIADARGTSERTVRQQARSVYGKAGVEGRTEFSAYILEEFFSPFSEEL